MKGKFAKIMLLPTIVLGILVSVGAHATTCGINGAGQPIVCGTLESVRLLNPIDRSTNIVAAPYSFMAVAVGTFRGSSTFGIYKMEFRLEPYVAGNQSYCSYYSYQPPWYCQLIINVPGSYRVYARAFDSHAVMMDSPAAFIDAY